jgi:hypothetical protein
MFANRPDKSNEIGTTAGGPSKAIPHPGRNRAARPFATILIPEIPDHLDIANIPLMLPQRQKFNHQTICLGFSRSPPNGIESLMGKMFFKRTTAPVLLIKTAKNSSSCACFRRYELLLMPVVCELDNFNAKRISPIGDFTIQCSSRLQ